MKRDRVRSWLTLDSYRWASVSVAFRHCQGDCHGVGNRLLYSPVGSVDL